MKKRVISLPWMGAEYTHKIKKMLTSLDLEVILPEKSAESLKKGVQNSADMMCFPYKGVLANYINVLDRGANTLLMYDSCGECRLKHYYKIHEFTLKKLGYKDFEMYPISITNIIPTLRKLSGKSALAVTKAVKQLILDIKEVDKKKWQWSDDKINIGIIGEIYTCCDERVNYQIEKKIISHGANPYNASNLSQFITESIKETFFLEDKIGKTQYKKEANKYLNGKLGGHGKENIYNLLWMHDKNVDGVIHLLPLSCMPEATIEPFINAICQEKKIPLLRLPIDETNSEANVDTRVETFIELIKRKKK